jgi:hypothetical protein
VSGIDSAEVERKGFNAMDTIRSGDFGATAIDNRLQPAALDSAQLGL